MDSVLTKPKTLQELYRTYFSFANKFEFTSLLKNYVQNEEWKETSQQNVWTLISKISDDIGAVLTDDIVNYTRNIVDINTCKVPQLIEHSSMVSYDLSGIKNTLGFLPQRIRCLVDIFSVNSEYLIGNGQNHILSDQVVKEILVYIRNNLSDTSAFTNQSVVDSLIENPHGLLDKQTYRNFVQQLFLETIIDALSASYSPSESDDYDPIALNVFHEEIANQGNVIPKIGEYRSWVDKYISNEIDHPLNDSELANTIYSTVEQIKNQNRISSKFNPFIVADNIYLYGLNPENGLSDKELELVEMVIDYHSSTKYDYSSQSFVHDGKNSSTKYAYYHEIEFIEYIKLVMFVMNNIKSYDMAGLTYDMNSNKFLQTWIDSKCVRALQMFLSSDKNHLVSDGVNSKVVLNYEILLKVSKFLTDYVFYIQGIRENLKTISQKHAMRGSGALLVHMVNDYLIKELPVVRNSIADAADDADSSGVSLEFGWEVEDSYYNYGNVSIVEYMDDNEYFNIEPDGDSLVSGDDRTNSRYWENLDGLSSSDSLGVLTKGQIYDFYKNVLGMGRLQPSKSVKYDYIQDFLVDLFKIGANPVTYGDGEVNSPIDDIINKSEEDYGYTKAERLAVQQNSGLRTSQERQFIQYSGMDSIVGNGIYSLASNSTFYWKNTKYSSHVIHPFMYNLKVWNRLNNIVINGYKDYADSEMVDRLSSRIVFDEIFGQFGESRRFWKYNIMDLTGYETRYEKSVKNEHRDDGNTTVSPLTGYDGLFYPDAVQEFLDIFNSTSDFTLDSTYLQEEDTWKSASEEELASIGDFQKAIYSIYWQTDEIGGEYTFYNKWYSHLNYTRTQYQKIALQLWYWRDRIVELATNYYPISKYCLDIGGNSLILVKTFKEGAENENAYLIDLSIAQSTVESDINENGNTHVTSCYDSPVVPSELWIRWKSNPIALPAFDVLYDGDSGDRWFDDNYRQTGTVCEFGQLQVKNNSSNEEFSLLVEDWRDRYSAFGYGNRLPVFFDMEQSANVLALSSWRCTAIEKSVVDDDGRYMTNSARNPHHVISVERVSSTDPVGNYMLTEYGDNDTVNSSVCDPDDGYVFESYHYCPASGALLLPFYRFICSDDGDDFIQSVKVRMFYIPAQQMKNGQFVANDQIIKVEPGSVIDLNKVIDAGTLTSRHLFGHTVKVCRNSHMVFSAYDGGGMDKVRCAFLGNFVDGNTLSDYKLNSSCAKTRYEVDSLSERDISLLNGGYFSINGTEDISYIDPSIYSDSFNSYDSLDKYAMVIEFTPSIENATLFANCADGGINAMSYNIVGDAGFIPHFAYQSIIPYEDSDVDCGTSYTWRNSHLSDKDHLSFELLGLDDKSIPDAFDLMQKMIVKDSTDDCDTLINPTKMAEDIYRIWCENTDDVDGIYFSNEYREYDNPELSFNPSGSSITWEVSDSSRWFELELPKSLGDASGLSQEELTSAYSDLLDEYYVSVLRTRNGEIQNEKRYILKPTPIKRFVLGIGGDSTGTGFMDCNLSEWMSSAIQDNHFVVEQVVFTGTQNPFNYVSTLDGVENGKQKLGVGNKIYSKEEELQYGNGICGVGSMQVKIDIITQTDENGESHKVLKPTVRFNRFSSTSDAGEQTLSERVQAATDVIKAGEVKVILSHRNIDNIAKYHILNRKSSLYYNGSMPKDGTNRFLYSDFKFSRTVELEEVSDGHWRSTDTDSSGNPVLEFTVSDVCPATKIPPYYIPDSDGNPSWFLEQSELVGSGQKHEFNLPDGTGTFTKDIPAPGKFKYAHLVKGKAEKYLDYLYVKNRGLSFKVNEESYSFSDTVDVVPPFRIDEVLRNNLADLNNVQMMNQNSTFIHQDIEPDTVRECNNFKPLVVDAVLNYGVEQVSDSDGKTMLSLDGTESDSVIELDNLDTKTTLKLELDEGEIDQYLKIYTNYTRVDDGDGNFHYDLYFNVQNLFNSPFEYISSVTGQANVLILPDSYLFLSGDRYTNGKVDETKMQKIREGGTLTVYGQVKTYSNDELSDVKTIKLFSYNVYNISDDKPKFMMYRTFDIRTASLTTTPTNKVQIKMSDILCTLSPDQLDDMTILKEDVTIIQPMYISYNWDREDDHRITSLEFDIVNDVIDLGSETVPELLPWDSQRRALTHTEDTKKVNYYDRWSDNYMTMSGGTGLGTHFTLKYDSDCGFNFETIYLKWILPSGFNVMDVTDRLNGYSFSTSAENVVAETNQDGVSVEVTVVPGHVVNRVEDVGSMYLGLEHSTTRRMNGYVLTGLAELMKSAIRESRIKSDVANSTT